MLSGSVSYPEEEEEDEAIPDLESFCREATPLTDMSDEQLRPIFWQVGSKLQYQATLFSNPWY